MIDPFDDLGTAQPPAEYLRKLKKVNRYAKVKKPAKRKANKKNS